MRAPSLSLRAIVGSLLRGLTPLGILPPQTLSEWASRHYRLSAESSQQSGAWVPYPFQIGWLDAMSNDDIEELDIPKSKRLGYTKCLTAFIAYNAAHRRRNQALWQPTDADSISFVKTEIDPMIRDVAAMRAVHRRGSGDTMELKLFLGSTLHILGGKAAKNFRRITVKVAMLDEADGFDQQVEKSSDPVTLAHGRLEGAFAPKLIVGSTLRIKGLSHVERRADLADAVMRFNITCPHCDVEHPLLFGGRDIKHGLKWDRQDPATVRHLCPHCHEAISQAGYLTAAPCGAWVSECGRWRFGMDRVWRGADGRSALPPRHVSMPCWAAYSPQRTWSDIVRQFLQATVAAKAGNDGPLQGFVNETLGEVFEIKGEAADEHALQARAESWALTIVQPGGLVLTAGVDVQGNRFEIDVWAWGRGLESWLVDTIVIEGNPQAEEDWEQVATHLRRRYTQAWHGGTVPISAISIDANYQTQAVLNFVRKHQSSMRIHAIRGENDPKKPIKCVGTPQDVTWKGEKWRAGVKLWGVGVKSAKDLLYGQLQITAPGPGYVHTPRELPREWYEQLTAEQRVLIQSKTGTEERWIKRRPRNEKLDCRNYALHAAHMLGLPGYTEAQWHQVEQRVQPPLDMYCPEVVLTTPVSAFAPPPVRVRQPPPAASAVPRGW